MRTITVNVSRWGACLVLTGALLGCSGGQGSGGTAGSGGTGNAAEGGGAVAGVVLPGLGFVASSFGFYYPEDSQTGLDGFDLDGRVSSSDAPAAGECAHDDFTGPNGEPGIDYNFLRIIRDEEVREDGKFVFGGFREGQLVDGVISGAVKNGSMTILLQVRGLDDPQNDDDVRVQIFASEDSPALGTDNSVLPGATLNVHSEARFHSGEVPGTVVDGVLTAGPIDLRFPIDIMIVQDELLIHDSWLRLELGEGTVEGTVSGYWDVANIRSIIGIPTTDNGNAANFTIEQFDAAMAAFADGNYDAETGMCASFSTMFRFRGVQAFLVSGGGGVGGAGGSGGSANMGLPTPTDQCTNDADRAALDALATGDQTGLDLVGQLTESCTLESCIAETLPLIGGDTSDAALRAISDCVAGCISDATGLSTACTGCYGLTVACGAGVCYDVCQPPNQGSSECSDCSLECTDLSACLGL